MKRRGGSGERNCTFRIAKPHHPRVSDLMIVLLCFALVGSLILPTAIDSSSQVNALQHSRFPPRAGRHHVPLLLSALQTSNSSFEPVSRLRIAAVEPIFTATAYSSFYRFYSLYGSTPPNTTVTTGLNLLNASIVYSWRWSQGLYNYLASAAAKQYNISLGKNLSILTDADVDQGGLFAANGTRNFDVAILGFTEYVTASEYIAYREFVEAGGIAIMMDATTFLAEVAYYPQSQHLALVRGHNWRFNGTAAWRDIFDRWRTNNTNWIGSTFWTQRGYGYTQPYTGALTVDNNPIGRDLQQKFGARIFTSYTGHEENQITNLTGTSVIASLGVLGTYPKRIVASYLHSYKNSFVIHSCIFGSDKVATDPTLQYFLARSLLFAANVASESQEITFYQEPSSVGVFTTHPVGTTSINGTTYNNASSGSYSYGLADLTANPPALMSLYHWSTSGGIATYAPTNNHTILLITGPGNLTAVFGPSNETIFIYTEPVYVGNVECGGHTYLDGQKAQFPVNSLVSCSASPTTNYQFTRWSGLVSSSSVQVTFNMSLGGTLTAYFTRINSKPIQAGVFLPPMLAVLVGVSLRKKRRLSSKGRARHPNSLYV